MLSMTSLGRNGRLGNQMFQYASMKGIAKNRGFQYCIPDGIDYNEFAQHEKLPVFGVGGHHLFNIFDLKKNNIVINSVINTYTHKEQQFSFDPLLFNACPDNLDLRGYFHSEKYFKHIRSEILEDFTLINVSDELKAKLNEIGDYVSIHVRRGDYVWSQKDYILLDETYYKKAMDLFPNFTFIVISDDIEWCKSQPMFEGCIFADTGSRNNDLYIMKNAKHNINANSSFSWWGGWLNENNDKIVVTPKLWFGPNLVHQNYNNDLIPEGWIKV